MTAPSNGEDVQAVLEDMVERLLANLPGEDTAAWRAANDSGLPYALLGEEHGGFGIDPIDGWKLLAKTVGHTVRLPLTDTMIANWALADAGLPAATGPAALVVAGTDDRIDRVPYGRMLETVAVARGGHIYRIQSPAVVGLATNLADEPRDTVAIDWGSAPSAELRGPAAVLRIDTARAVMVAAALEQVLSRTVRHAGERHQFGRPLAAFQAIQQSLAILCGEVVAARAAADMAVESLLGAEDPDFLIAAARVRIGEATGKACAIAHQIHGAMGFTAEHALHRFTLAALAWREEGTGQATSARLLGKRALATGAEGYWPMVVGA